MEENIPVDQLLEPPNAYLFSVRECAQAYRLNQFAIGLKNPDARAAFVEDERTTMQGCGLLPAEIEAIESRNWTALIAGGAHVLAVVKIAYSLGILHHEVCAHMCGMPYSELKAQLPRETDLLPHDLDTPVDGTI